MNTLQDLRDTLDAHAAAIHDDATHARTAAVRGHARAVRRRRAVAVGGAAAVAVAAVVAGSVLPGDRDPVPADRQLIGKVAPATIESLGYTYDFLEGVEGGDQPATLRLTASDEPRLVSWASGADRVRVDGNVEGFRTRSEATDFDDFMVVPAGQPVRLTARAGDAATALAVYELGDERPPGVTVDGITFRERIGSGELLAARIGDPGQSELGFEVTLPTGGEVRLAELCHGELPEGYWVNVEVGDAGAIGSGGCGGDPFDPGAGSGYTFDVRPADAGDTVPVRAWVSRRFEGPAVTVEDVRLGAGVYDLGEPAAVVAGWSMPELYEHDGHLWRFVRAEVGDPRERAVAVRNETAELLLAVGSYRAAGSARVEFRSAPADGVVVSSGGGSGSDLRAVLAPGSPPARLRARGAVSPRTELGFALYTRVD